MKIEESLIDTNSKILVSENLPDAVHEAITNMEGKEDSFVVLDIGDLVTKVENWKTKLPRVKPFYAVKSNDTKAIRQTLAWLGIGFDCASKGEINMMSEMGVNSSRIVYAHPCKGNHHIRYAVEQGVDLTVFDNESELIKIKELMPKAKLLLRIACDAFTSKLCFSVKFGAFSERIVPLLSKAKSLDLNVVGISFYVGTNVTDPHGFTRGIEESRKAFDAAKKLGFSPYLLDIGGGFPGSVGPTFDNIAEHINEALEKYFPEKEMEIISEPGRYFVETACTMVTQVTSLRITKDKSEPPETSVMYHINDGIHGSFSAVQLDNFPVTPTPLKNFRKSDTKTESTVKCSIWGPTCDSLDIVVSETRLPKMEIGEWIVWENMGAYSVCSARTFNGFPKPLVFILLTPQTSNILEDYLVCDMLTN